MTKKKRILAIDPGNIESAYVLLNGESYNPIEFDKSYNEDVIEKINYYNFDVLIVEMIASYGLAVGKSVFDTCVWIGRFIQEAQKRGIPFELIYRKEEKMNLCHSMKAKDTNIRQALIDRFGEVGTKTKPGFFYGFKKDIWSAFAVGVTYLDKIGGKYVE